MDQVATDIIHLYAQLAAEYADLVALMSSGLVLGDALALLRRSLEVNMEHSCVPACLGQAGTTDAQADRRRCL